MHGVPSCWRLARRSAGTRDGKADESATMNGGEAEKLDVGKRAA
jgi:hypothetical protein